MSEATEARVLQPGRIDTTHGAILYVEDSV